MVALRKAKPMEILKKSMPSAEHSVPLMPVTGTDALRPVPDSVLIPSGSPFINPFSGNRPKWMVFWFPLKMSFSTAWTKEARAWSGSSWDQDRTLDSSEIKPKPLPFYFWQGPIHYAYVAPRIVMDPWTINGIIFFVLVKNPIGDQCWVIDCFHLAKSQLLGSLDTEWQSLDLGCVIRMNTNLNRTLCHHLIA